ncbi:MAG: SHD1 domain-containing protein [Pirellulaceae bacterium]
MKLRKVRGTILQPIAARGLMALTLACMGGSSLLADELREWSDSTGRFKITAKLIEVRDGVAILENAEGKSMKIPVSRLSSADQEFLNAGDNPFQMLDDGENTGANPAGTASSGAGAVWGGPKDVDWDRAEQFASLSGVEWNVTLPATGTLDFEPKRSPLPKKANFHEDMHALAVNTLCKRAVVGYTVSFSVPKPLTRICLVDLVTGKSIHSEQVEARMRPLALLDNGSAILMCGASDERGGYETPDQLQVWRLQGKKIIRTPSWIPYPMDKKDFGKQQNAKVLSAQPVSDNLIVTISDKGHLVLWDIFKREPIWHGRLNERNFAFDLSLDRKLLAVADNKTLMVLNPLTAEILGSSTLDNQAAAGWNRVAWSPSGKRILFTAVGDVRVFNVESGEWEQQFHLSDAPIATRSLSYPHEDYALLDNHLLVHLPTKIQVCDYRDATRIETQGGTAFIGIQGQDGGLFVPAQFPHPAAVTMLEKAQKDPSVFLIHPGVGVSIDVNGAGQHQAEVRTALETAVKNSGYKLDQSSPIKIVGAISGPKQEAVSYIARGSYVVNEYTSSIKLVWNGKNLWATSGSNIPGMLMTSGNETIEQALEKAGKKPNLAVFERVKFPEFMQRPSENQQQGPSSIALMQSKFTLQGLVDSK